MGAGTVALAVALVPVVPVLLFSEAGGASGPRARLILPRTGHVGMIVGSAARSQIWRPAAAFLAGHRG